MAELRIQLPTLYAAQHAAFFNPARYSICEASTKAGKTLGCITWQAYHVLSDTRALEHWWVAPIYPQADIAYRRVKKMLRPAIASSNDTEHKLVFLNGARWLFKSGEKPDNLYGEDVAEAVLDEFTRMREEAWHAVRSTLTATEGSVRLIGNVKGRGWGYQLARRAESGSPGFSYHKITAADAVAAGVITQAEVDDAERVLPRHVFRELYFCEPSDDGGNPFGIASIDTIATLDGLHPGEPVAYGVDLAKSVDWTVVIGLDREGRVCRLERWQQTPWDQTVARIDATLGKVPALIDATGVGDPIVEQLQRGHGRREGFKFTSTSKQDLMLGLAAGIQQGKLAIPREGPVRLELEQFEYRHTLHGVRYEAAAGAHDDCVCALALAWQLLKRQANYRPPMVGWT